MEIVQGLFGVDFPVGLLALAAIPLILILYLAKPKPEKQKMPSMAFLMQDKKSGKLEQALAKLQENFLLIIHLLVPLALGLAVAQAYFVTGADEGKVVMVLDNSASMDPILEDSKEFLRENTAEVNTLIVANSEAQVQVSEAGPSTLKSELEEINPTHRESNLASALDLARGFEGELIIASDLRHSVDDRDPQEILESIDNANRQIQLNQKSQTFDAIVTSAEKSGDNLTVSVFAYEDGEYHVSYADQTRSLEISEDEINQVEFEQAEGENWIELEDVKDPAGSLPVKVPDDSATKIKSPNGFSSKYLEEAVSVSESLEATQSNQADMILADSIQDVEQLRSDEESTNTPKLYIGVEASVEHLRNNNIDFEMVNDTEFNLRDPVQFNEYVSEKVSVEDKESVSGSESSAVRLGDDNIVLGVDPSEIGENPVFPILVRELAFDLTGENDFESSNLEIGQVEVGETQGFAEFRDSDVAVRQTSVQEFRKPESYQPADESSDEVKEANQPLLQHLTIIALLLIALDIAYLFWRGDIR